jgi:predicted nucleic acid-binding protein
MQESKTKVLLDTSVILQALRGNRIVGTLFTSELEIKVTYFVDPVVLQEILLASAAQEAGGDPDEVLRHLNVITSEAPLNREELHNIKQIRNRLVHANDWLILDTARDYDVLLTYDNDLHVLGRTEGVNTKTPEDFLAEFGVQS